MFEQRIKPFLRTHYPMMPVDPTTLMKLTELFYRIPPRVTDGYFETSLLTIPKSTLWTTIPLTLRQKITQLKSCKRYMLDSGMKLIIATDDDSKNDDIIGKISTWFQFIMPYRHCTHPNLPTLYLYLLEDHKELPKTGKMIDVENVNSAFTTVCGDEITIFRREEWFKVLIHESFHILGLDFSGLIIPNPSIFRNLPNLKIAESYCETWATLLNILFVIFFKHPQISREKVEKKIADCLQWERAFSLFQSAKILQFHGITIHSIANTSYHENTAVFSYYIIKSAILLKSTDFIVQFPFPFRKTKKAVHQYSGFVESAVLADDFLQGIDYGLATKKTSTITDTLRMTVYGFG
jgi:hypothetical protein